MLSIRFAALAEIYAMDELGDVVESHPLSPNIQGQEGVNLGKGTGPKKMLHLQRKWPPAPLERTGLPKHLKNRRGTSLGKGRGSLILLSQWRGRSLVPLGRTGPPRLVISLTD